MLYDAKVWILTKQGLVNPEVFENIILRCVFGIIEDYREWQTSIKTGKKLWSSPAGVTFKKFTITVETGCWVGKNTLGICICYRITAENWV